MIDNVLMGPRLSIGDFSRMTHLSIKTLRHYHEVGLLAPASIDPSSGYRYYGADQVGTAQIIRRFRDLGVPVDEVKALLLAPDVGARNEVLVAHLQRMQDQLEKTEATVASLRALLEPQPAPVPVEYRVVRRVPALAVADTVTAEDALDWWVGAFDELYTTLARIGLEPAGPGGALFPGEFYELEKADLVAFVPLSQPAPTGSDRARPFDVPDAELAVAVHAGPFGDIDRTYGQLGLHVAERAISVDGPIREYYLVTARDTPDEADHRIEVCWPIFQTT
ncbi:MAG TPA: MerR family transcriptional regulator [Acidimicrobiales bacterium]|nr:MerR family transcriptional regulator [Acidimicrobiales bacterium]